MDELQHDLRRAGDRARRYWFEDGLAEISGGSVFLVVALYLGLEQALRHTPSGGVLNMAFPLAAVALALAGRRLVRIAKDRFVHPRTGYVEFRRPRRPWITALLAAAMSALMAFLLSQARALVEWLPAVEGLMFAGAFLYLGRRTHLLRFPVEGLVCVLLGTAVSLFHPGQDIGTAMLFAGLGVTVLAGGFAAFAQYVRQAPPPEQP